MYDGDSIVGFCAVIYQPDKRYLNMRRVSRLVILPDYQGIGLGRLFLEYIARMYTDRGDIFHIRTSARNLIYALRRSGDWRLIQHDFSNPPGRTSKYSKTRTSCMTAMFSYRDAEMRRRARVEGKMKLLKR